MGQTIDNTFWRIFRNVIKHRKKNYLPENILHLKQTQPSFHKLFHMLVGDFPIVEAEKETPPMLI